MLLPWWLGLAILVMGALWLNGARSIASTTNYVGVGPAAMVLAGAICQQALARHAVGGQDEEENEERRDENEQRPDDDGDETALNRMHFHAGRPSAALPSQFMTPLFGFRHFL